MAKKKTTSKEVKKEKPTKLKTKTDKKDVQEEKFNKETVYPLEKALDLTKELSKTKFESSVEVHIRLGIDPKKGDQQIRSAVSLPHGTGKTIVVAAFVSDDKIKDAKAAGADIVGNEDLVEKIKKTEKTDFAVAVAEPSMMKHLGQIAKILGTRGLMPSPKNETVTPDPIKAITELKKGKISYKNDDTANVHAVIGKTSFETEKLVENFTALFRNIVRIKPRTAKGTYIKNISFSSTMGPGVKSEIPKN